MAFAILVFALGLFGVSRVGGLPAKIAVGGAVAWAQDSTPADDAADDAAHDDSGGDAVPLNKKRPHHVAGPWCGSIYDNQLGSGNLSVELHQRGTSLSGRWSDDLGFSGTFTGKIKGDAVTGRVKKRHSKCKVAVVATLVAPDEITGSYTQFGCHQSDGGTFDITSPSC
jgi:hypothetical protein